MFKTGVFRFLMFAFFALGMNCAISGQIYNPSQYNTPVFQKMYDRQFMTNLAVNGMMRSQILSDSLKGGKNSRSNRAVKDPLQFKPSGVKILNESDLAQMTNSEQEKVQLAAFFDHCLSFYTKVAKNDGYAPNDLAYAFNFFVTNNYHTYKNILRDYKGYKNRGVIDLWTLPDYVNSDKEKAVYSQFRTLLLSNTAITKMSDPEKEKVTAYLALMTNVAWIMYDEAITAGDQEAIDRARQLARQNLEGFFGTSVDKIMITNAGVELKK